MNMTRQQRRKVTRLHNKGVVADTKTPTAKRIMDERGHAECDTYTIDSSVTAYAPFCMVFSGTDIDMNSYTHSCREGAETLTDNDQPKFIILIREPGATLPADKELLMKIGTRIFAKAAPRRTYIFLGKGETHWIKKALLTVF